MPVNGIGSPSTPRTTSTTSTSQNEPVAGPAPQPEVGNQGWQSTGGTPSRSLDLSIPRPQVSAADIAATTPSPARQQLEASLAAYTAKVEVALGHDAMSIARGKTPVREGDQLTASQQNELEGASRDLLTSIPIGALNPELAEGISEKLRAAGLNTRDVATTPLKDFGRIGGDIAQDLVKSLKQNSPAGYYSLAAGLAAVAGIEGYKGGSAKLERLGIRPEVSTSLFDNQLELKLRANFDPGFKNFNTTATLSGHADVGAGRLSGSVSANSSTGFEQARVQYDLNNPNLNLSVFGTANRQGLETAGASVVYRASDNLTLSGGVNHNFQTDSTSANAEASWKIDRNTDFALSASHVSGGETRVGAGLRITF